MEQRVKIAFAVMMTAVAAATVACGSAQPVATGSPPPSEPTASSTRSSTSANTIPDCEWRDKKVFVQIRGWVAMGDTKPVVFYLREARKKPLGESFETEDLDKPSCQARMPRTAPVRTLNGASTTPEELIDTLSDLSSSSRDEGFDVTFGGDGAITQVDWLFVPAPTTTPTTTIETKPSAPKTEECAWRNEKKFVQIVSTARLSGQPAVLHVREARKKPLGESFETETLDKPLCQTTMPDTAQVNQLRAGPSTTTEFLKAVSGLSPRQRNEGFDVTFDNQGVIARVDWLFSPS